MKQENTQPESESKSTLTEVTPLSKYLAMALFVALPFIGGWIGYFLMPEKVVEVERTIEVERVVEVEREQQAVPDKNVGIAVTSPKPNDLIKLPVTVAGSISGDGWFANEGEVGSVELFDANDKSISNTTILKATSNWLELPTTFEAMVGDRQMMSYIETDTGYLKLTNRRDRESDSVQELIIPVRFK